MNLKQVMLILAIIIASLLLIAGILFAIYKFAPQLLGIKPAEPEKTTETMKTEFKSEPKVVLSRPQYDEWLQKSFNAKVILEENKFLLNYRRTLQDSIQKINRRLDSLVKLLDLTADSIAKKEKLVEEKDKNIKKLLAEIEAKNKQIAEFTQKENQQRISGKPLTDSARQALYSTFAKIYENANPKEVAKIFENLSDEHVISILRLMSKKKAGKIIDALNPERSAAILQSSFEK